MMWQSKIDLLSVATVDVVKALEGEAQTELTENKSRLNKIMVVHGGFLLDHDRQTLQTHWQIKLIKWFME